MNPLPIPACEASDVELENELRRRGCAVVVVTPDDVIRQWRSNMDADNVQSPDPTEGEARRALAVIQRMMDRAVHESDPCFKWGATSDACELIVISRRFRQQEQEQKERKGGK
jgi:predicted ATPase